jgi:hypothetical protein
MPKISLLTTETPSLTDTVPGTDVDSNNDTKKFTIQSIVNLSSSELAVDTPSSASDTGTKGQYSFDTSFFYICVAPDTWMRTAIATW